MAAHSPRRCGRRRRHTLRRVRAGALARPHHRGRGARRVVQTGGKPSVPRPRRGHRPRQSGRRPRRPRIGHPLDGELPQRSERTLHADSARAAGPRSADGDGAHRRHARGVRRGRSGRDPERHVVRRAERPARAARAVDRAAEPPRVRARGVLPPVRLHPRVPELQRVSDRASRRAACALPLLQLRDGDSTDLRQLRRSVP